MPSIYTIITALAATSLLPFADAKACPPLGKVLPAPQKPSQHEAVKQAAKRLEIKLNSLFEGQFNTSGVSVGVKSIHEDKPLFNYHYTPPIHSGIGTAKVDEHSIYRVGSLSKMMPALAVRQAKNIKVQDSVLKYLPDLGKRTDLHPGLEAIDWNDITIEALASHLSGLSTDMAFDLAVFSQGPWTKMGLPSVPKGTGPDCSGLPGTKACTVKDIIDNVNRKPPVYEPYTSPVYSNLAYAILGMVVEATSGADDFNAAIKNGIFDAAGMKSTSFSGPVPAFKKQGFVPKGETTFNSTLGVFEAAGGMFSNTVDMLAFSEAILSNKLLSPIETRKWMKPTSHTSSLGYSVGAPWEILRSNTLTKDRRVIDVYTKSGDLGLYHALMGLIGDYDLVLTVLAGGLEVSVDPETRTEIFSAVLETLLPAIDCATRAEANSHVGTFIDKKTNSSLTLRMDDGPGIIIESFQVQGFDVLSHISSYSIGSAEAALPGNKKPFVEGRLYPVDITSTGGDLNRTHPRALHTKGPSKRTFRAIFEKHTEEKIAALDKKLFNVGGSCESWFNLDRMSYNYLSLAEFVFVSDQHGTVEAVKNAAFDVTLGKT